MQDVATDTGFRVIAAVGAVAEHSIIRRYGKGRPDAADEQILLRFGRDILSKAESGACTMPQVPGHRPYKKGGIVPQPKGRGGCNRCGVCAKQCPADAIPLNNPKTVDTAKCIFCMRCVSVCPTGSRRIGVIMHFLATQGLKKVCATRKEKRIVHLNCSSGIYRKNHQIKLTLSVPSKACESMYPYSSIHKSNVQNHSHN